MNAVSAKSLRRFLWPRSLAGKAGIVALVFALLLGTAWTAALRYSAQRLEEAWKLSDEFGFPNDLAAHLGPLLPPERNMTVPLDLAASLAKGVTMTEYAKLKLVGDADPLDHPSYVAAVAALLQDNDYEAALAEADRIPEYRSPVVLISPLFNISLTYLQTRRDLVRAEQAIARHLTAAGKKDDAARRLVRIARLTRRWADKEPFLVGALVNIAIRTVAMEELNRLLRGGSLAPAVHDEIDRETAETENILQVIPRIGHTEKLACLEAYDAMSPLGRSPILRPLADNDKAYLLRYLHRWMKLADRPLHEIRRENDALDEDLRRLAADPFGRIAHLGAVMLAPAVNVARKAFDRIVAKSRCLRIVNEQSREGVFRPPTNPISGEYISKLPKECWIDPFDGKPMRVKSTPTGPIVYSIGPDLNDNAGNFDATSGTGWDVGLGPIEKKAEMK